MQSLRVFLAALIFMSGAIPAAAQSITMRKEEGGPIFPLGVGIDRVTSSMKDTCITFKDGAVGTSTQNLEVKMLESSTSLVEVLNVGAYASYFGAFASMRARLAQENSTTATTSKSHLYLKVSVTGLTRTVRDVALTPQALELLALDHTGTELAAACGDSFVTQIDEGAELLVIVEHQRMNEATHRQFMSDIQTTVGNAAGGGDVQQRLAKTKTEYGVTIAITQVGLPSLPLTSVSEFSKLIDDARQFAKNVSDPELNKIRPQTSPHRAQLQKYADTAAFRIALLKEKGARLINFDPSLDTMNRIVTSYDLALQRANLATNALSNPVLFKKFDTEEIKQHHLSISTQVQKLGTLAKECASQSKAGKTCSLLDDDVKLLIVETSPLVPLPACITQTLSAPGCMKTAMIEGTCRCLKCGFISENVEFTRTGIGAQTTAFSPRCLRMPPGRKVRTSFSCQVGHAGNLGHLDFTMVFNFDGQTEHRPNQRIPVGLWQSAIMERVVPANGEVTTTLKFDFLESNAPPNQIKGLVTRGSREHVVEIEVVE